MAKTMVESMLRANVPKIMILLFLLLLEPYVFLGASIHRNYQIMSLIVRFFEEALEQRSANQPFVWLQRVFQRRESRLHRPWSFGLQSFKSRRCLSQKYGHSAAFWFFVWSLVLQVPHLLIWTAFETIWDEPARRLALATTLKLDPSGPRQSLDQSTFLSLVKQLFFSRQCFNIDEQVRVLGSCLQQLDMGEPRKQSKKFVP